MGKYLNLKPIARFDKSIVPWVEGNFRAISAALSSINSFDVGAAPADHTHAVVVEAFSSPVFVNGWTNFAGHHTAAYYKDPQGRVHLRGTITGGTVGAVAFTLPAGYRPLATILHTAGESAQLEVRANGNIVPSFGTSANGYGINFSFRAEQ